MAPEFALHLRQGWIILGSNLHLYCDLSLVFCSEKDAEEAGRFYLITCCFANLQVSSREELLIQIMKKKKL